MRELSGVMQTFYIMIMVVLTLLCVSNLMKQVVNFTVRYSSLNKTHFTKSFLGNSLVVQWLELGAFTAKGVGSITGWGTKILQTEAWPK